MRGRKVFGKRWNSWINLFWQFAKSEAFIGLGHNNSLQFSRIATTSDKRQSVVSMGNPLAKLRAEAC